MYEELVIEAGPHRYDEGSCLDPVLDFYKERCENLIFKVNQGILNLPEWNGIYNIENK